ncbi:MAG TPA: PDZ domain-containing protein [Pyrinomonadaceae bacterium]|jgi:S1-C subfamily serine protease
MRNLFAACGGRQDGRTLARLAVCGALLYACGAQPVYAQSPQGRPSPPRRAPMPPVPTTQTKSGVAAPAKFQAAAPQVIAVVHRMSGWKLRTLLTPADASSASNFDENFVRTNIVAGFILPDGRSVIARLPQAEAEMLNLSTAFRTPGSPAGATTDDAELLLVRPDGVQFRARFIGLDASTGLSLLESDKPLLAPAAEPMPNIPPVVGQRVRVIAPVRAATPAAAPAAAPIAPAAATPAISTARPEDAPVGDEGVIYMNMSEEAGQLREVRRSPSGRAMEMTLEVDRVSPEWAGGVALSETGTLIGIIEESDARATRLMSAETVRGAARRVRARRASVPQPWLGARGDAVAFAPLEQFLARGWRPEEARLLVSRQRGVLLTSVAPGTPAAHAGLRPGDVISRIGEHDVRSIEDMSSMIKELGGNTLANFTVLRAESAPLKLAVRLSESPSPGLDTARAELRALQSELRATQFAINSTQKDLRRLESELSRIESERERIGATDAFVSQKMLEEWKRTQARHRAMLEQTRKISTDYEQVRARMTEAEARYRMAVESYSGLAVRPLLSFGLEAVRISPAATKLLGTQATQQQQSGLLVISVRPGSAAARSRIQTGDIIESVNGQKFSETNWNFNFSDEFDAVLSLGILRSGEKLSFDLSRQNSPR